jgi:hypothetical protein
VREIRLAVVTATVAALAVLVMAPLRAQELSTVTLNAFFWLVEDLRATVGLMERPTPPPSKFVTPAWYDLALRLRGQDAAPSGV